METPQRETAFALKAKGRPTIGPATWYPVRDSNPCYQIENLASWASRRTGPVPVDIPAGAECQPLEQRIVAMPGGCASCSGGRTRTPNDWTRTSCVANYTTPERWAPKGHDSVTVRYRLPACRKLQAGPCPSDPAQHLGPVHTLGHGFKKRRPDGTAGDCDPNGCLGLAQLEADSLADVHHRVL